MRLSSWHCAVLLMTVGMNGCAFWDEVTTRTMPRSWKDPKDPLLVLRDSTNGDQRARALQILREPKQHNGSDAEQDMVVKVLTTSATKDAQPLCRLSAIETLGSFQDPRAVDALKDAYFQAASFPADTATVIQVAALEALGRTRQPAAVPILSMVVREPAPALTVPLVEKRQAADRKTAAVRALANFPQLESAQALVHVLKSEKDVGLRNCAHESLEISTGRKLPADAEAWEKLLTDGMPKPEPNTGMINLTGWWN